MITNILIIGGYSLLVILNIISVFVQKTIVYKLWNLFVVLFILYFALFMIQWENILY